MLLRLARGTKQADSKNVSQSPEVLQEGLAQRRRGFQERSGAVPEFDGGLQKRPGRPQRSQESPQSVPKTSRRRWIDENYVLQLSGRAYDGLQSGQKENCFLIPLGLL